MDDLTQKQKQTLKMLWHLREKNGMTPTQRELVKVLGVTQNAVRTRLNALARKGYIMLLPRLARGIVIITR